MANVNQEIDTIRVGGVDYEVSDPHALYGEHDESAPDLTDNPLYESDLVTQVTNDSTKPSAANVPYQLKQEINQLNSDLASKVGITTRTIEMQSTNDVLRLDDKGITPSNFISAVVVGTNYIGCVPMYYSTSYYVAFVNLSTMQKVSGQYNVIVTYAT